MHTPVVLYPSTPPPLVMEPIFTKMIPRPGVGILKMIPCSAARPCTEKYMSTLPPDYAIVIQIFRFRKISRAAHEFLFQEIQGRGIVFNSYFGTGNSLWANYSAVKMAFRRNYVHLLFISLRVRGGGRGFFHSKGIWG